uniref:Zf-RVT domain-containing protein n=1 Tax=Meloidogyne hapla TaxID=6305 RepID=A0A1I8BA23_MELHA
MHQLVSNINRKRLNLPGKDDVENPLHCIQHSPQCPICDTNLDVKRLKTLCPNFTVSSMIDKMLVDVETNEVHGKGHSSPDNGQPDNGDQILQMIQANF